MAVTLNSKRLALSIPLETTDTKVKTITIGSVDKPNIKYNLGDMAEGVVGAAICARFIFTRTRISMLLMFMAFCMLCLHQPTIQAKKGKYTEKTFKSLNANKKVSDDVEVLCVTC